MDLGSRNNFHLLTSEVLLQMTIFEKMVDFDNFYRDPKKSFTLLINNLHDWRKIETIVIRGTKKENLKVQRDNLALFKRKHGVAHEEESDNELKN